MRKLRRVIKIIILSIIVSFVVMISGSWVYHSTVMKKEIASTPPGILVYMDGHSMHVYTEGVGEQTIVFLSGAGTSAPMIDAILEESRTALQLASVQRPYVLAAHSMSGLEAIRWTQKYPEEVEAIIGLDPTIPAVYKVMPLPSYRQN